MSVFKQLEEMFANKPSLDDLMTTLKRIIEHNRLTDNSEFVLSGSLALKLQGIELLREPSDLDILVLSNATAFKMPLTMRQTDSYDDYFGDNEDEEEFDAEYPFQIFEFLANIQKDPLTKIRDIKIDVFFPTKVNTTVFSEHQFVVYQPKDWDYPIKMLKFSEIMKFKIEHASMPCKNQFKHKEDLIHMISKFS